MHNQKYTNNHAYQLTDISYKMLPSSFTIENEPATVDVNFAPSANTWQIQRNITLSLILAHWFHYVKT